MTGTIRLRDICESDLSYLRDLYGSTREDELRGVAWSQEQKAAFIQMQFRAQHEHYHARFPRARYALVLLDGERAGRLYVDRRPDAIHILDITIDPARRGRGLGTMLLGQLQEEADRAALPVTIFVETFNARARALYERLGFRYEGDPGGVYLFMRYRGPR